jgi:16S rRNA (guanine1207-N2)-methyltransferase
MSDGAFELLLPQLQAGTDNLLWLVDENIAAAEACRVQPRQGLTVMCNRYDIAETLRQRGFAVELGDFDLGRFTAQYFDRICYRVSKEKALVHHLINCAGQWLKAGGQLSISGFKNDGIKTYADKAQAYLGELAEKQRGNKTAMLFSLAATDLAQPLDDQAYSQPRLLELSGLSFYSKPGVFGWNKVDKGSAFLIEHLPALLNSDQCSPARVLDLGCGYGYLTMQAAKLLPARFTATDNNHAAVELCRQNLDLHGIEGEVVLDNCAANITGQFDLILCNPPFHQGFDVEGELTERFLNTARRLLAAQGQALFVVNAFIPLERKASGLFRQVKTLANNRSFKLVLLAG